MSIFGRWGLYFAYHTWRDLCQLIVDLKYTLYSGEWYPLFAKCHLGAGTSAVLLTDTSIALSAWPIQGETVSDVTRVSYGHMPTLPSPLL